MVLVSYFWAVNISIVLLDNRLKVVFCLYDSASGGGAWMFAHTLHALASYPRNHADFFSHTNRCFASLPRPKSKESEDLFMRSLAPTDHVHVRRFNFSRLSLGIYWRRWVYWNQELCFLPLGCTGELLTVLYEWRTETATREVNENLKFLLKLLVFGSQITQNKHSPKK